MFTLILSIVCCILTTDICGHYIGFVSLYESKQVMIYFKWERWYFSQCYGSMLCQAGSQTDMNNKCNSRKWCFDKLTIQPGYNISKSYAKRRRADNKIKQHHVHVFVNVQMLKRTTKRTNMGSVRVFLMQKINKYVIRQCPCTTIRGTVAEQRDILFLI